MDTTPIPHSYRARGSVRSRVISALLALVVAALIVLGLILSGFLPRVFAPLASTGLSTFDVSGGSVSTPVERPKQAAAKAAARETPRPPASIRPPPEPVVPMPVPKVPGMIVLSRDEFAAADIGKVRSADVGSAAGADKGATADSGATYGPGEGPGGRTLYAAQWVREPTRQELAFYMPAGVTEGWATIACRTIERNHVDNCRVIGETPGSRIGNALRQAAWQFLVLPPRIDGKPMVGTWVRIRFDLVRGVVK